MKENTPYAAAWKSQLPEKQLRENTGSYFIRTQPKFSKNKKNVLTVKFNFKLDQILQSCQILNLGISRSLSS